MRNKKYLLSLLAAAIGIIAYCGLAYALPYAPGQTLDPSCSPGSANCTVQGVIIDNGTVAGVNATSSTVAFNIQGSGALNPFNVASSSGTSLLTVLANGNVGIGTSNPATTLDVYGNGVSINNQTLYLRSAADSFHHIGYSTAYDGINDADFWDYNGALVFSENTTTPRMVLLSSGNVGIGSSSPTALLTVSGTSTSPTAMLFNVASSSYASMFNVQSSGSVGIGTASPYAGTKITMAGGGMAVWDNSSEMGNLIDMSGGSHGYSAGVNLTLDTSGSTDVLQVRNTSGTVLDDINSSGYLGVGTSTVINVLTVQGATDYGVVEILGASSNSEASIGFRSPNVAKGTTGDWGIGSNLSGDPTGAFSIYDGGPVINRLTFISGAGAGINTSTPVADFQATDAGSNATTTVEFGKSGQNKGTCIKLYRSDGSAIYASVAAGATTFTLSTTACASVSGF